MAALRKKPRMPPKFPSVPKKARVVNPREKPPADRRVMCALDGGPWAGGRLSLAISHPTTMVMRVGAWHGRYRIDQTTLNTANIPGRHKADDARAYWQEAKWVQLIHITR